MLSIIIGFLIMLNPFALFLYLQPIRKDLNKDMFHKVIFKATLTSFLICLIFFYFGDVIFEKYFNISFDSFRIFGGIIIFSFSYLFIVKGQEAMIIMKEDLDDLASEIALPFMVGAGTISLSILLSQKVNLIIGTLLLVIIFIINFFIISFLNYLRESIQKNKIKVAFDKNMEVLLRLNGFFIGAIGINMVISGIRSAFFI